VIDLIDKGDLFFVGKERGLRVEDKIAEEIKRHFDVVAEDLKDEIKLVAEGYSLLNEKIDELRKENTEQHQKILSALVWSD